MSLHESPSFNLPEPNFLTSSPLIATPISASPPDPSERLVSALDGVLLIRKTEPIKRGNPGSVVFSGTLIMGADESYATLVDRFNKIGFTPMLERYRGDDVVIALNGLVRARRLNTPWWLHLGLLLVTILTTILGGAVLSGFSLPYLSRAVGQLGQWDVLAQAIAAGAPFALTLLSILGVHEMGHYIAARRHGIAVTLPFFIPIPPLGGFLGTLGAVIFIKEALTNRKTLFDVGISGPLAGLVVALPAFVIGLLLPAASTSQDTLRIFQGSVGGARVFGGVGIPPLLDWIGHLFTNADLHFAVLEHPVALAAWFGVLLTVINLLPIGQLDGGHVVYTLFGRRAWVIAAVTFVILVILGLTVFQSFLFYAALTLLTGLRHPPPGNDITPLDPLRKLIGVGTIILFGLIMTLTPFIIRG